MRLMNYEEKTRKHKYTNTKHNMDTTSLGRARYSSGLTDKRRLDRTVCWARPDSARRMTVVISISISVGMATLLSSLPMQAEK